MHKNERENYSLHSFALINKIGCVPSYPYILSMRRVNRCPRFNVLQLHCLTVFTSQRVHEVEITTDTFQSHQSENSHLPSFLRHFQRDRLRGRLPPGARTYFDQSKTLLTTTAQIKWLTHIIGKPGLFHRVP